MPNKSYYPKNVSMYNGKKVYFGIAKVNNQMVPERFETPDDYLPPGYFRRRQDAVDYIKQNIQPIKPAKWEKSDRKMPDAHKHISLLCRSKNGKLSVVSTQMYKYIKDEYPFYMIVEDAVRILPKIKDFKDSNTETIDSSEYRPVNSRLGVSTNR